MADVKAIQLKQAKHAGLALDLVGLGRVRLAELISENAETAVYRGDHPGVVIKMFDLECGKADEVSYGPYVAFNLELENFQDINAIEELKPCVPALYGANIDYDRKHAYIAMEYLSGQHLVEWCQSKPGEGETEWAHELRSTIHATFEVVTRFHRHGIFLIDFKPHNVIRLDGGGIKFVDLGAFFTPRHSREAEGYVYSATPDYAELVIDTSNVQTGRPLNEASDIFAAGVALFELATGRSRLAIADETADQILGLPELYRFRDSQIRDVWHAYPHLEGLLPLVETQLKERQILFAEAWHLVKGLLTHEIPDWDARPENERQELILSTGTNLISEQLPWQLDWLAKAIALSTTLRSFRLKTVADLMRIVADPIGEELHSRLLAVNGAVHYLEDQGIAVGFLASLNTWEVREDEVSGQWAISLPAWCDHFNEMAAFTFLRCAGRDRWGHVFFEIVSDLDADCVDSEVLTAARFRADHAAWII